MSELYNQNSDEFERLLRNSEERSLAIGEIFDDALEAGDQITLRRILSTYSRKYLDEILGGYPEYLEEELGEIKE